MVVIVVGTALLSLGPVVGPHQHGAASDVRRPVPRAVLDGVQEVGEALERHGAAVAVGQPHQEEPGAGQRRDGPLPVGEVVDDGREAPHGEDEPQGQGVSGPVEESELVRTADVQHPQQRQHHRDGRQDGAIQYAQEACHIGDPPDLFHPGSLFRRRYESREGGRHRQRRTR